jgi:hypothetical protein
MKKLIIILAFIAFAFTTKAQTDNTLKVPTPRDEVVVVPTSPWDGFFHPTKVNRQLTKELNQPEPSAWLVRPAVSLIALQLNWNKDTKGFDAAAFESAGLGIGYQHYIWNEGVPYNNWGANLLFLFPLKFQESVPANLSVAATVDAFRLVNAGVGYNITLKMFFILTGITYNF